MVQIRQVIILSCQFVLVASCNINYDYVGSTNLRCDGMSGAVGAMPEKHRCRVYAFCPRLPNHQGFYLWTNVQCKKGYIPDLSLPVPKPGGVPDLCSSGTCEPDRDFVKPTDGGSLDHPCVQELHPTRVFVDTKNCNIVYLCISSWLHIYKCPVGYAYEIEDGNDVKDYCWSDLSCPPLLPTPFNLVSCPGGICEEPVLCSSHEYDGDVSFKPDQTCAQFTVCTSFVSRFYPEPVFVHVEYECGPGYKFNLWKSTKFNLHKDPVEDICVEASECYNAI